MTLSARGRDGRLRLTDAGIETVLIHDEGFDLPSFAAFPLLDDAAGRAALAAYERSFLEVAGARGAGFVLETPTWRANAAWGPQLGYDVDALRRSGIALNHPSGWAQFIAHCYRSEEGRIAFAAYREQKRIAFTAPRASSTASTGERFSR